MNLLQNIPLGYYIFAALLNFIACLSLSAFVFLKDPRSNLNRIFSLFCFSIAQWSIFYFLWLIAGTREVADFYLRTCMIGVIFMPVAFTHFIIILTRAQKNKILIISNYLIALIIIFFVYTTLFAIKGDSFTVFPYWSLPGKLFPLHLIHFFINLTYSYFLIFRALKYSKGFLREQIRYVFLGTVIGFLGGWTNYLYWYRISYFPPVLNITASLGVIFIAYGIIKYRLMDIKVALTRTGIFIAVYTLILGLPFAVAGWFRTSLIDLFGPNWWIFPLGLMAALATVGPFIYIYIQRKAEDRLLKEQRRYQDTLKQASVGITRIRNLRKLLDLITHIVTKTVKISYAAIYLYNRATDEFVLQVSRDKGRLSIPKLTSDNPLITWITKNREPLIYEEVKRRREDSSGDGYKELEENMRLLDASVVIPSFLEDRFMGFIVLGDKISGQIYTPDDLNVFQVLASQAALAIENAQFYEEAKEMQEQISQAEKMATIGTMADGLSHQINNRFYALSLIAGDSIDTIKLTDTSKCTPEVKEMIEQINHALERIQANVMQGGEVVRGILKYSRKGDEGFVALDLNTIIDNTLEMVQYKVKLSDIDIIRNFPNDIPKIKGNMAQLEEVFFNFIDNAYDAITERRQLLKEDGFRGKIIVSAQPKDSSLEIIVEDNGIGIKDGDNKKVFTPFFTTKTSSRRGTGLGLYVIRRIITDTHRGKVAFESQYKVGTRFILELPIAK
jgi:signal transduction histidine kinase